MNNLINSKLKDLKEARVNEDDVIVDFIKLLADVYMSGKDDKQTIDKIANYIIDNTLADDVGSESYMESLEDDANVNNGKNFKSIIADWIISLIMVHL